MLTLMRNVGLFDRLSVVISQLTEGSRRTYAVLSQHVNFRSTMPCRCPTCAAVDMATDKGRAMMDPWSNLQAPNHRLSHDYQMVMIFTLCASADA